MLKERRAPHLVKYRIQKMEPVKVLSYTEPLETRISDHYDRSPKAIVIFDDHKTFLVRHETPILTVYEARSYFKMRHSVLLEIFPSYSLGTYMDSLVIVFLCPMECAASALPVYSTANIYECKTVRPAESGLLGRASALSRFYHETKFCSACGCILKRMISPKPLKYEHNHMGMTFTRKCVIGKQCILCKRVQRPPYYSSVIGIVVSDDKALCYQRRGNLYTHVAGFVDPGEGARITMVRELREEMGIVLNPGNCKMMPLVQPWPTSSSFMFVFYCAASEIAGTLPLVFKDCEALDGFWANLDKYKDAVQDENLAVESRQWLLPDKKSVARWMYDVFFSFQASKRPLSNRDESACK